MNGTVAMVACLVIVVSGCAAGRQVRSGDTISRDSYSLGYEFGDTLRREEVAVDPDVVLAAVRDGLSGAGPSLSSEEMRATLQTLRKKVGAQQERRHRERVAKNLEQGKSFLAANAAREGVTTLPDGLQYEVIREGDGPVPKETDVATVNYRGTLIDGTEFDSSYARGTPLRILVAGVMKGWTEALTRMKAGSIWRIFVPPELAYGKRAYGRVPSNATLIFELELLSVGGDIGQGMVDPPSDGLPGTAGENPFAAEPGD